MRTVLTAIIGIVVFVACVSANPLVKRQVPPGKGYDLPAGAEEVLGEIKTTFSCDDKIYGYYADVDNDCKVFHVCVPVMHSDGKTDMYMYSFFCGNQTVFDQETLVCINPEDAWPCEIAPMLQIINENFGQNVWHTTPRPVNLPVTRRPLGK